MENVIAFRKSSESRVTRDVPEGGAEVVIFPGVRVEYHTVDLSHRVMSVSSHDPETARR